PRVGARAERPLHRGASLLEAGAEAWHAGRAQVLPPRDDRALPRTRVAAVVRQGVAAEPALLAPLEPAREEVRVVKRLIFLLGILIALVAPAAAAAHPLGNFTVNRFSGIELSGDRVYVKYVLDMAEIPAFQERQKITDETESERELAVSTGRGLDLRLDGRKVALEPLDHALAFPPGAAGLRTLRFEAVYAAPASPGSLELRDTNFANRIGW